MSKMDKIIKDKLYDHEGSYSSDMWSKIEAGLGEESKKRPFPWLIAAATLAAIAIFGTILLYKYNDQAKTNAPNISLLESEKNTDAKDFSSVKNIAAESKETTNVNKKGSAKNIDLTKNTNNQSILKRKTEIENTNQFKIDKKISPLSSGGSSNSSSVADITETKELKPKDEASVKQTESIIALSRSLNAHVQHLKGNEDLSKLRRKIARMRTECPSFSKEVAGVFLDLYLSHEYGIRKFAEQVSGEGVTEYKALREETEKQLYSFSAGIRVSLMLPNNVGLKTGINYSQINEKFEYFDPESVKEKIIRVTEYTYENGAVVDSTVNSDTIVIGGEEKIKIFNKYRSLDIPLLLSYEWAGMHGFYFSSNAGILMNFGFNQRGKILEPSTLKPQWFSSSRGDRYDAFESSLGISLYGSLGMYYNINKYFDFMLEPNIRINMKSMTLGDHPVSQKYIVPGLITGLRVKF